MEAEPAVLTALSEICESPELSAGIRACKKRRGQFSSRQHMELAGAAMDPDARRCLESSLDTAWDNSGTEYLPLYAAEVVIGAGLHAAVYCAARVAAGHPKPLVLEAGKRPGGAFAVSTAPAFWLNSRNRPGLGGEPGNGESLNYLPGAPLQVADFCSGEFPGNADMALAVRLALALHADVRTGVKVTKVARWMRLAAPGYVSFYTASATPGPSLRDSDVAVTVSGGQQIRAGRVIDTRGLGDAKAAGKPDGRRILTFAQFMAKMDGEFPLKGMERVAVIGKGDSAKCAVEALTGLSPQAGMGAATLDWPQRIDWFAPGLPGDCEAWRTQQRGRYQGIGAQLGTRGRVQVTSQQGVAAKIPGGVMVNGRPYTHAVIAAGYERKDLGLGRSSYVTTGEAGEGTKLAVRNALCEYIMAGPVAQLPFTERETAAGLALAPENQVAIWRLAPRTAALAQMLS